ncbi:hypothetical protein KO361_06420 [Candidatus Woesearchaeota archaeon]|nr:hypothetical protein [Candidatus Woesearchaeota archaeon]
MQEIRLYYESLEQGNDYLLPMINKAVPKGTSIKLVKRPKKANQFPRGALSSIMSFTTPDALITAVKNGIEYPLAIIEFTEAVKTEDHELQRTYGALASYLSETFYIKISGHKESEKVFGGAEYNPYSTPKILIDQFGYEGYIIAEWRTKTANKFTLQRNQNFPSCPPEIPILRITIQAIVKSFLKSEKNWFENSIKDLKQTSHYKSYRKEVDNAIGAKELLATWKARKATNLNKLRYFVNEDWIGAKINRFSHAMDPDRGILNFISFVFSKTHKIFGIYALVRPRGNDILKKDLDSLTTLRSKLKEAIAIDSGGVPRWFTDELVKAAKRAKKLDETINFQPIWEKHKSKISDNKVVSTIAFLLDGMYLNHNGIKLVWDRRKLLGNSKGDMLDLLKTYFSSTKFSSASALVEESNEVDEDEVTYAIAHRVLIPNKFKIVSISYPGSQGGGAILPNPDLGKAQPREYPDIIALPPRKNAKIDVLLNESKGMFRQADIEKDTAKILRYKHDKKLQTALKETLVVAQVIDQNDKVRNIIIGVAFGVKSNTHTTWKPDKVDFIFRITDRKKWSIGIFNQALRNLIPKIEGNTNFPTVYKLAPKHIETQQITIEF